MDYEKMTDTELIVHFEKDAVNVKEELYRRYYMYVYAVALKLLKNVHEAEDVTQNVFLTILVKEKIRGFKERAQFKSWICRVAINASYSFLRNKKMKQMQSFEEFMTGDICSKAISKDDTVGSMRCSLMKEELESGMRKLAGNYGKVLYLFYFKGLSYSVIARKLNTTSNSVGVVLKRGREKLVPYIEKAWSLSSWMDQQFV